MCSVPLRFGCVVVLRLVSVRSVRRNVCLHVSPQPTVYLRGEGEERVGGIKVEGGDRRAIRRRRYL